MPIVLNIRSFLYGPFWKVYISVFYKIPYNMNTVLPSPLTSQIMVEK